MSTRAFIANLRRAIFNRKNVKIAGGEFSPDELRVVVSTIENADSLLNALECLANVAESRGIPVDGARAAIARVRGVA